MYVLYNLCAGAAGYIVDAVVAAIIVIFVIISAKRGFITCFFGFVSTMLAFFVAVSLAKVVVSATGGFFGLQGTLETKFIGAFSKISGFDVDVSGQNIEALLATQDMNAILATLVLKNYTGGTLAAGTTLGMLVGETAAELATVLIAGIVLFILCRLLMFILKKIGNMISRRIRLLNALNRLFGAIIGIIEILLIVSLLISILTFIPSESIVAFFDSSVILRWLYHQNPLVIILGWFL